MFFRHTVTPKRRGIVSSVLASAGLVVMALIVLVAVAACSAGSGSSGGDGNTTPIAAGAACTASGTACVAGYECNAGNVCAVPIPACDADDADADCDNDGIGNASDVDDDNDGLIEIATAAELDNVRNDLDGSHYDTSTNDSAQSNMGCLNGGCNGYELTAHIALAAPQAPATSNWVPIGDGTNQFAAIFEGNGFGITALEVSSGASPVGFFGSVGSNGVVRNLHVAGTLTATGGATIGGLVGSSFGLVSGCSVLVRVTGSTGIVIIGRIGGLVGSNSGTIENSSSSGTVTGGLGIADIVGGLVGNDLSGGAIRNSWSDAAVNGGGSAVLGGLVGQNVDSAISNSYATGVITAGSGVELIGGLTAGGFVEYSYASATIAGGDVSDTIGGVLAVANAGGTDFTITDSYHTHTGGVDITGATRVTADQLTGCTIGGMKIMGADAGLDCSTNSLFSGWSANNWAFGTASQFPALRSYKVDGDGAQIMGDIMCGQPGQTGTPQTRATRATNECDGALVPLPPTR